MNKKSISVSNLTLDLWLDYIRPALRAADMLEEVPALDDWHEFTAEVIDGTAAYEIASCMTRACMGAGMDGIERSHEEYIRHEAERMVYQLEVSIKYDQNGIAATLTALLAALTAILNTTTTEEEEEEQTMFTTYEEAVTADVREYIANNYSAEEIAEAMTDREEFEQTLNDDLWVDDCVTGNGSGSYTFDSAAAREYVLTDIDTVREALREFGTEADTIAEKFLGDDWEYFDVTARCYVLGQAISAALDEIEAEAIRTVGEEYSEREEFLSRCI